MSGSEPVTVYLDTQDYSRFGDVLRGKSWSDMGQVFHRLKELRRKGIARFVYSMPILSELLQYDPEHEDTTLAKARAVEELCGDSALLWLPRLIETQAASFGRAIGLPLPEKSMPCIRTRNEWFPRISSELTGIKERISEGFDGAISEFGPLNRKQRRVIEVHKGERKIAAAMRAAAPEFAEKYGISIASVVSAILPLLKGKRTAEDASRLLFGAIAKPTAFVNVYFRVQQRDKSLPAWIRGMGEDFARHLVEFRRNAEPLLQEKQEADYLRSLLKGDISRFGRAVLGIIDTEEAEQGITAEMLETISNHPDAPQQIASCEIASAVLLGYLEQTVAVAGSAARVEGSFAGDLIHSLYIDCVHLWRGDRRFAALLKQRLPSRRDKIQPLLKDLPEQIESVAAARSAT
jgi:hypothetical protein